MDGGLQVFNDAKQGVPYITPAHCWKLATPQLSITRLWHGNQWEKIPEIMIDTVYPSAYLKVAVR